MNEKDLFLKSIKVFTDTRTSELIDIRNIEFKDNEWKITADNETAVIRQEDLIFTVLNISVCTVFVNQ